MNVDRLRPLVVRLAGEGSAQRIGGARRRAALLLALHGTSSRRRNTVRIRQFEGRHRGETCVIMGNGPSLRRTPTELLRDVPTFGLNRIFLGRDLLGFDPTYLVCVNPLVLEQSAEELHRVRSPLFVSWHNRHLLSPDTKAIHLYSNPADVPEFSTDPSRYGVWEGSTVTYVAMQLAYYMGFSRVVLVGVDHSFQAAGRPHQEVTSVADDIDHFDPNYFGKGFRWHLPDLDGSEVAYRQARVAFERAGREIVDATVDGKLQIFPKLDLQDALPLEP